MKFKPPTCCADCTWFDDKPPPGYKTGGTCHGCHKQRTEPSAAACNIGMSFAGTIHRIAELEADIEAGAERRTDAQYQRHGENWIPG